MVKKIWVLERWTNKDKMAKTYAEMLDITAYSKETGAAGDVVESLKDSAIKYKEMMEQNPEGYWLGYVGRSNYKRFCSDAKNDLRYFIKEKGENAKNFRVVEATIEDDAKYWIGYTVTKVNDGVLRYLLATM